MLWLAYRDMGFLCKDLVVIYDIAPCFNQCGFVVCKAEAIYDTVVWHSLGPYRRFTIFTIVYFHRRSVVIYLSYDTVPL